MLSIRYVIFDIKLVKKNKHNVRILRIKFDIFYLYHATHIVFLLARFNFIAYIYYLHLALLFMERVNIEYGPYKDILNHLQNWADSTLPLKINIINNFSKLHELIWINLLKFH